MYRITLNKNTSQLSSIGIRRCDWILLKKKKPYCHVYMTITMSLFYFQGTVVVNIDEFNFESGFSIFTGIIIYFFV